MSTPSGAGTFLVLGASLLLAAAPAPRSAYWIGEVEGVSMAPLLHGERKAFECSTCHRELTFDRETTESHALLACEVCGEWQVLPKSAQAVRADRVVVRSAIASQLKTGDIAVISHPRLGIVIKRIAAVAGDCVLVDSRGTWVNGVVIQSAPSTALRDLLTVEELLVRHSVATIVRRTEWIESPLHDLTVQLPPRTLLLKSGEFFVVGDDLENSVDSRDEAFGVVQSSQIAGKVVGVLHRPLAQRRPEIASTPKAK